MGIYTGHPDQLKASGNQTQIRHDDLEADISKIPDLQVGYAAAFHSDFAGKAIKEKLEESFHQGTALKNTLQQIIDDLNALGLDIHAQDLAAKRALDQSYQDAEKSESKLETQNW